MKLSKDGITIDVSTREEEERFRGLGYRGEGEPTPLNTIDDYKKKAEERFKQLTEELQTKDNTIKKLKKQIEQLKK